MKLWKYESNASYFFSETTIKIVMKFIRIMDTSFTKLMVFFHKVYSLSAQFPTFAWNAVCRLRETLC
jgi:hypothetical protein